MTKPRLTPRQKRVYEFIRDRIHQRGVAPTYREIGAACGLSSTSSVRAHVLTLVAAGKLCREPYSSRTLTLPELVKPPALPSIEEQVGFWMDFGAVVVGYQRQDGTLVDFEAWHKMGDKYLRVM